MNARRLAALLAREASVFLLFAVWAAVVTRPLAFRMTTHTLPGPDPLSHLWMVNWLTGHAVPAEPDLPRQHLFPRALTQR
jgi:hypothetical protein